MRDGTHLTCPRSDDGVADVLSTISSEDATNWRRFGSYCSDLYAVLLDTVYREPTSTIADVMRLVRARPTLMKYLPSLLSNYQAVLARYFTDRAQESFAFQAVTMGLPPALLPGIFAFVPYGELRGSYYPRGGMIRLPQAIQRVGERRHGMRLHLRAPVRKVLIERGRAIGVAMEDGTEIRSDVVVSNVNAKTLYLRMIGDEYLPPIVHRGVRSYHYDNGLPMVFLGCARPRRWMRITRSSNPRPTRSTPGGTAVTGNRSHDAKRA